MSKKDINVNEIEKKIGYVFKDKTLLLQAFTRTSFCNEQPASAKVKYQSNEVLEFFGDGVLSVAIISFLLKECTERYEYGIKTDLGEGDFSNIKSKLSDKQNLSKSMKSLGLQKHLRMGEGDAKLGIENEPSVMEDLFESIVGAIYIDSDMSIDAVIKAVSSMLDMSVYTERQKPIQSAKNALQEWCADKKRRLPAPRYETLSEDGPDHKKTYMRGCYIGDRLVGRGIGKNFKLADADAAEDALKTLMTENDAVMQTKIDKNAVSTAKITATKAKAKSNSTASTPTQTKASIKKETAKSKSEPDKKNVTALAALKAYASSQKKSSPIFKDLGEIRSAEGTECRVECAFSERTVTGAGKTRSEARDNAAALMVEMLSIGKRKKVTRKTSTDRKATDIKNNSKSPAPEKKASRGAEEAKQSKKSSPKNSGKPAAKAQKRRNGQRTPAQNK